MLFLFIWLDTDQERITPHSLSSHIILVSSDEVVIDDTSNNNIIHYMI